MGKARLHRQKTVPTSNKEARHSTQSKTSKQSGTAGLGNDHVVEDNDPMNKKTAGIDEDKQEEVFEDAPAHQGLLNKKRKSIRERRQSGHVDTCHPGHGPNEWQRPYWLGGCLFLILLAFWLLDSLKDPIFARLVDGKINVHQPPAKLCSVLITLLLVCLLEYLANVRQRQRRQQETFITPHDTVLDPGGIWWRMPMMLGIQQQQPRKRHSKQSQLDDNIDDYHPRHAPDDTVSVGIFFQIGAPYVVAFLAIAYYVWQFEQQDEPKGPTTTAGENDEEETSWDAWYVLGYVLYATVESFGSLAVATFWSYTNSTLNLEDAERYYGPIIATAQLGAIAGSTMVASGRWEAPALLVVVALTIILQLLVIKVYDRRFLPTSLLVMGDDASANAGAGADNDAQSVLTWQDNNATLTKPFWSGLYLIFRHSYVTLILGVSCLYEISMTLLDYQMKLLGFARFDGSGGDDGDIGSDQTMSFSEFMGRYGQMVNFISLLFSSLLFPWLIRRVGLRKTLLVFPTLLLVVTFLAYGLLPGNLTVLFFSLSLLKAMTYSVHDPSKELLYIPTSNAVKFRAKFWIDVVGERISKAIGSAFNTLAGTVEQSVKIGSVPSLLSSLGLWLVCYYVGKRFDRLLATGKIVGLEHGVDPSTYSRVPRTDHDNEDDQGHSNTVLDDSRHSEPSELELLFEEQDNVSTLDLMADPVHSAGGNSPRRAASGGRIELPPLIRI